MDPLKAELERINKENQALKSAPKYSRPPPQVEAQPFTIYPHQVEGIKWLKTRILAHQSSILADDMGLGKTLQSLQAAPENAPILVICPLVAKGVWKREVAKFTPYRRVKIIKKRADFRWPTPGEVVVINFDSLPKVENAQKKDDKGNLLFFPEKLNPETQKMEKLPQLEDYPSLPPATAKGMLKGTVVIVDEAQKVKNPAAKRTQALRCISFAVRKDEGAFVELTGTPLMNKPQECWALLVAGGMQFDTFGDFRKERYETAMRMAGGVPGRFGGWEFSPHRVQAEFAKRLARVMLRRTKDEVLNLPPKRFETLEVDIPVGSAGAADEILESLKARGINIDEMDLAKLQADIVFEKMSSARKALAKAKIGPLVELVETCEEQDECVIVFSAHLEPVETLATREGWRKITGSETAAQRTEIEELFQAGKLKGLAATIRSTGVALTLTRASRVIFCDQDWNPANNSQAMDRAYRIGQDKSILVTVLVANHPLDDRLATALAFKEAMMEAIVERVKEFQTPDQPIAPPLPKPEGGGFTGAAPRGTKPVPKPVVMAPSAAKPIPALPEGVEKKSREGIAHYLKYSDAAVERALVVLYKRQTADEQTSSMTKHQNGVGFNGIDANFGTDLARWVLSGKHLSPKQLEIGRRMVGKYVNQLLDVALQQSPDPK